MVADFYRRIGRVTLGMDIELNGFLIGVVVQKNMIAIHIGPVCVWAYLHAS